MKVAFAGSLLGCVSALAAAASLPKNDGRIVMRDLANCMAKRYAGDARQYVDISPVSASQPGLVHPDCMAPVYIVGGRPQGRFPVLGLKASIKNYRYAFAEALLLRRNKARAPEVRRDRPPLTHPAFSLGTPVPVDWSQGEPLWLKRVESSQREAKESALGECVVRAAPEASWTLLRSEVGGDAEHQAFTLLTPIVFRCAGSQRAIPDNKTDLRGTIALNLYRLTDGGVNQ